MLARRISHKKTALLAVLSVLCACLFLFSLQKSGEPAPFAATPAPTVCVTPPAESTAERTFEPLAVSCFVSVPDGYGAVREETRSEEPDFVSSDGLCRVQNKTLSSLSLDIDGILASFSPQKGTPTVIIYHTHTSEGYAARADGLYKRGKDGLTDSSELNGVIAAGNALAESLTSRGITVIHLTDTFDSPSRSGSFLRSRAAVEKLLSTLTRADLVIDLHRGVWQQTGGDRIKPTLSVSGQKTAQITLIGTADDTSLAPTLALSHALHSLSPHLSLPVSLEKQGYNLTLDAPCVMAEIGTDVNTVSEAENAASLLGEAIASLLL